VAHSRSRATVMIALGRGIRLGECRGPAGPNRRSWRPAAGWNVLRTTGFPTCGACVAPTESPRKCSRACTRCSKFPSLLDLGQMGGVRRYRRGEWIGEYPCAIGSRRPCPVDAVSVSDDVSEVRDRQAESHGQQSRNSTASSLPSVSGRDGLAFVAAVGCRPLGDTVVILTRHRRWLFADVTIGRCVWKAGPAESMGRRYRQDHRLAPATGARPSVHRHHAGWRHFPGLCGTQGAPAPTSCQLHDFPGIQEQST
jgi:hypothetical protein